MKLRKALFLSGILFTTGFLSAQDNIPIIIPPPPEAASIFKFIDVPLSHYAGTANINIPLYEIESGGYKLPISISYNSRGVKVDEIASRVGTGWALNCGGMISRQIRGTADEHTHGNFKDNNFYGNGSYQTRYNVLHTMGVGYNEQIIPDQYFYSVNNLSGKFIYDHFTGAILLQKFGDVKIQNDNAAYKITDEVGNVYDFGGGDIVNNDFLGYDNTLENLTLREIETAQIFDNTIPVYVNMINTWYLSKITTPTGKKIEFMYEDEVTNFYRRSYDKYVHGNQFGIMLGDWPPDQWVSYVTKTASSQRRIKKISFEMGNVFFYYSEDDREDLEFGKALEKIVVENYKNKEIKVIEFKYDFIASPYDNSNVHSDAYDRDQHANKRMFLKSVQVVQPSSDGGTIPNIPKHEFIYNDVKLPNRHSTSQDSWGYFNGAPNGKYLKNKYDGFVQTRAVDTINATAGLLRKIIYPEGGSVTFKYEQNDGLSVFPNFVHLSNQNQEPSFQPVISLSPFNHNDATIYNSQNQSYLKKFTVVEGFVGEIFVDNSSLCGDPLTGNRNVQTGCTFLLAFAKRGANPSESWGYRLLKGTNRIELQPGNYSISAVPNAGHIHQPTGAVGNDFFQVHIIPRHKILTLTPPDDTLHDFTDANDPTNSLFVGWQQLTAAGKRIAKIEYRDSDDSLALTKTYKYNLDNGDSAGVILGMPTFQGVKDVLSIHGQQAIIYEGFGSGGGSPFSTYQENAVGYRKVTEYTMNDTEPLGKTEYTYTITPDSGKYYEFPYHPPTDNEWLRGKELTVKYFKSHKSGDSYIYTPVKTIENKYLYADVMNTDGVSYPTAFVPISQINNIHVGIEFPTLGGYIRNKRFFRLPVSTLCRTPENETDLFYKTYYLTGGTMDLSSTKVTDYLDNNAQIQTETNYFYNYDTHYNLAREEVSTTATEKLVTKYFYPGDNIADYPLAVLGKLTGKNIRNVPLLTQKLQSDELLSTRKIIYKDWNPTAATPPASEPVPQLAPQYIQTSKGEQLLETRVEYVKVDPENGNPLEVKRPEGTSVVYLWGYKKNYPIAKIENATAAEVGAILNVTDLGLVSEIYMPSIDNLRTNLPNALVTTMTYEPLVGVKTIKNPNWQETTFYYDAFNRLELVRDHNGNKLTETEYFYALQN